MPNSRRTINAILGVLVGFMAFTVTMLGQGCKLFESIAWYYNENALKHTPKAAKEATTAREISNTSTGAKSEIVQNIICILHSGTV